MSFQFAIIKLMYGEYKWEGLRMCHFKMSITLSLKCFKLYESVYFGIGL